MAKSQDSTLLLVDGNAIVHRAFHALPPFTAPDGRPTGAVYGFFSTLLSAIKQFEPSHIAVAFDVAGPTFRHEAYKEYKAKRIKPPQQLYDQIPIIQEILQAMNVSQFGVTGYEADDVIATIVAKCQMSNVKCQKIIILTGDLDILQLVSDSVSVCALRKGIKESVMFDEKTVKETFGFEPNYMVDYKALRGDPSDNIPGVPGIGEKTAASLIGKYHTVANVWRHITQLPEKLQTTLRSHENELQQSRQLVTLRFDVPIAIHDIDGMTVKHLNHVSGIREFEKLGMKSMAKRIIEISAAKQGTFEL